MHELDAGDVPLDSTSMYPCPPIQRPSELSDAGGTYATPRRPSSWQFRGQAVQGTEAFVGRVIAGKPGMILRQTAASALTMGLLYSTGR